MISVLILTKNEEQDLPDCIDSVRWSDDIHVFDSVSTDRTVEIANSLGAKITQRPFDNWSSHQNWGLRNLPFKHSWVLYVDADERVTPGLRSALAAAVANPGDAVAFRVQRRDFFRGTWLKHVQATPYYIRLFRPQRVTYERLVNPVTRVDGSVGQLAGYIDHYPFSKGISHWITRHNSYSSFEAEEIVASRPSGNRRWSVWKALTSTNFQERRYHQKELFYRLPARPLLKFFLLYFAKRGFLDGRAGFTYSVLQAFYEYLILLKTVELTGSDRTSH
jgi:glycosyltransferase involved in cell wall biosynthesis